MDEILTTIASGTVFVDFFAEWCKPCQRFLKIVNRLKLPENVTILKIDIDKFPEVKQIYNIIKIPTFLIFKNGQEQFRQEGVMMTLAEITKTVEDIHNQ